LDLKGMFNSACYRIYRAALIHEHQIQFDPAHTNGEDFLFNCEFFKTSEKAAFVHKVVYHYMREDMPTVLT
ncbi:MAG TPA: hypothetical protein DEQ02_04485, partial [Ruminococcaceae bacterium]|nr:hypothetical protein [Oscillospiraceae bacterium]